MVKKEIISFSYPKTGIKEKDSETKRIALDRFIDSASKIGVYSCPDFKKRGWCSIGVKDKEFCIFEHVDVNVYLVGRNLKEIMNKRKELFKRITQC